MKPPREALLSVSGKLIGMYPPLDGEMVHGGAQILSQGQDIDTGVTQIVHRLSDFAPGFAEAQHQAGFGQDRRSVNLGVAQYVECLGV